MAFAFNVILREKNCNIFKELSKEDYQSIRARMISMVLATDMSSHFSDLAMLKGRLATTGQSSHQK